MSRICCQTSVAPTDVLGAYSLQQQALQDDQREVDRLLDAGTTAYQRALRARELTVFGVRLAFTLPLLLLAAWCVAKQRASRYWPLLRGFVIAAAFAFFF